MEYHEIYIKEKVTSNYKIATFILTTFLVTTAGLVSLYQKDDIGILFVIGVIVSAVCFIMLLILIWSNITLIKNLKNNGD
jgi:uncharacterized membrane protein YccC